MDEASETESQGRNSKVDEDGSTIPAIITDEYFDEITSKCQAVSVFNNTQCSYLVFTNEIPKRN